MNNPNNGGDDDLTLLEVDQNTVRPKAQAQAQQTGSNPAVTVRPKAQAQAQAQAHQTGSNPAVTVRPKAQAQAHQTGSNPAVTVRRKRKAQAHQTGSNPAVTVRRKRKAQAHHDVTYYNFMGLQDPPELHECFVCQKRYQSVRALCGHMRDHPERGWRGLYPPHAPKAIRPPFFYVPEICPPPIAK